MSTDGRIIPRRKRARALPHTQSHTQSDTHTRTAALAQQGACVRENVRASVWMLALLLLLLRAPGFTLAQPTESPTASSIASATPTLSHTQTLTPTLMSPSLSATVTAWESASPSAPLTATPTRTETATVSVSASEAASGSASPSLSASESGSASTSASSTLTPSEWPSVSYTATASPTGTATRSATLTVTQTVTRTSQASPSTSRTPTRSATPTRTPLQPVEVENVTTNGFLPRAGGAQIRVFLTYPIFNAISNQCGVRPPKCWVNARSASACMFANASLVTMNAPPAPSIYSERYLLARVTVELCGALLNLTSDGRGIDDPVDYALAAVRPQAYATYDPGATLNEHAYSPAIVIGGPTTNLSIGVTLPTILHLLTTQLMVAGISCGRVAVGGAVTLTCLDWPYSVSAGNPLVGLGAVNASAIVVFRGVPVQFPTPLRLLHRPILTQVMPRVISPGGEVAIFGQFLLLESREYLSPNLQVTLGGVPCANMSAVTPGSVICRAGALPTSLPGYPRLAVALRTQAGMAQEPAYVDVPVELSASILAPSIPVLLLPGSSLPPVVVRVLGEGTVTCFLAIVSSSCAGAPPVPTMLLGETSNSSRVAPITRDAMLTFSAARVVARTSCSLLVGVSCRDALARDANTENNVTAVIAAFDVRLVSLINFVNVVPSDTLRVWGRLLSDAQLPDGAAANFSCSAVLRRNATAGGISAPAIMPASTLASFVARVSYANAHELAFEMVMAMDATRLHEDYVIASECMWRPTEQTFSLDMITVSTARIQISGGQGMDVLPDASVPVSLIFQAGFSSGAVAQLACAWRTLGASIPTAQLIAPDFTVQLNSSGAILQANLTLQAPTNATLSARVQCETWQQIVVGDTFTFRATGIAAKLLNVSMPIRFIPSDSSSPWPAMTGLAVGVYSIDGLSVRGSRCKLVASSLNGQLVGVPPFGLDAISTTGIDDVNGVVHVPPFGIQARFPARGEPPPEVELSVLCSSGSAVAPAVMMTFVVIPLFVDPVQNMPPPAQTASQVPLRTFAVQLSTAGGAAPPADLPSIACSIVSTNMSSANGTGNMFTQNGLALVAGRKATFDAFTIVGEPARTYGWSIRCAVGELVIPNPIAFTTQLTGCAEGFRITDMFCQRCGADAFSLGGVDALECHRCPPVGARCVDGVLQVLPNYFRPPRDAGKPFTSTSELHQCPLANACEVNVTDRTYACARGYTGPLCGVCDSNAGFGPMAGTCSACWDPVVSRAIVALITLALLGLLTYVALRKTSGKVADASIAARILLTYLQAVGSLKGFKAGGTPQYRRVMAWTDVLSSNPLSLGCVWDLPFLAQFTLTATLPLLAAAAVILIFLVATVLRSSTCSGTFDADGFRSSLRTWWKQRRHMSTLIFVLFLAYMPITTTSLKVLDCYEKPIAGTTYLRMDLRVRCDTGQHAVAAVLAKVVLAIVGAGLPVALLWFLSVADATLVSDPAFHSAFGFLYDGYKRAVEQQRRSAEWKPELRRAGGSIRLVGNALSARAKLFKSGMDWCKRCAIIKGKMKHLLWWEAIVLLRKAGIVLLAVQVRSPSMQISSVTLWLLLMLGLQLRLKPYAKSLFNVLETLSLVSALLTCVIGTMLLQFQDAGVNSVRLADSGDEMSPLEWVVTLSLILINVITVTVLASVFIWLLFRRAKAVVTNTKWRRASISLSPERMADLESASRRASAALAELVQHVNPFARSNSISLFGSMRGRPLVHNVAAPPTADDVLMMTAPPLGGAPKERVKVSTTHDISRELFAAKPAFSRSLVVRNQLQGKAGAPPPARAMAPGNSGEQVGTDSDAPGIQLRLHISNADEQSRHASWNAGRVGDDRSVFLPLAHGAIGGGQAAAPADMVEAAAVPLGHQPDARPNALMREEDARATMSISSADSIEIAPARAPVLSRFYDADEEWGDDASA